MQHTRENDDGLGKAREPNPKSTPIDGVSAEPTVSGRAVLRQVLQPRWKQLLALSMTSLGGGLVEAAFLVLISQIALAIPTDADTVEFGPLGTFGTRTGLLLAVMLLVLRVLFGLGTGWLSSRLSTSVTAAYRHRMSDAFINARWSAQHGERSGRLQELLTTFVTQGTAVVSSFANGLSAAFSLVAMLVVSVVVDPTSTLLVVLLVGALGLILKPVRAAVKRQAASTSNTGMNFATALNEIAAIGLEMHTFNVQRAVRMRVSNLIDRTAETARKLALLKATVPVLYVGMAYLAIVGVLGLSLSSQSDDLASAGGVMLIMLRSLSYGQAIQMASTNTASSLPYLESLLHQIKSLEMAGVGPGAVPVGQLGGLHLNETTFSYDGENIVLNGITATLGEREVVGVIGPSGGGKSTLVQLLLALRSPISGSITANDRPIEAFNKSDWARAVTFVPQEPHLIAGTVADNIRFFRADVTAEQIEQASRLANLHDDVMAFPDRYERQVGEQGSHLSGGQQQRLIIARALVENPQLLILDEPTSALDVRSEHLIRQTLHDLRDRMTIIIIAHRLSTLGDLRPDHGDPGRRTQGIRHAREPREDERLLPRSTDPVWYALRTTSTCNGRRILARLGAKSLVVSNRLTRSDHRAWQCHHAEHVGN